MPGFFLVKTTLPVQNFIFRIEHIYEIPEFFSWTTPSDIPRWFMFPEVI